MRFTNLLLLLCLLLSPALRAEDIYVAQSSAGGDTGADCANAHSVAWLNISTNWAAGAGKVSAGDTVLLCGTITAQIVTQGSGTSGNVITLKYLTGASSSSPLWATGAIRIVNDFITIDSAILQVNVECTANGTGLANATDAIGIYSSGQNVTIQNLWITNIYKSTGHADNTRFGQPTVFFEPNNLSILNNRISDGDTPIGISYGSDRTNCTILGNILLNCNHGIGFGTPISNRMTTTIIASNRIDLLDTWDYPGGGNNRHLDGIIIFNNTSAPYITVDDMAIFCNTFGPNIGTNTTAAVFVDGFNSNNFRNIRIYDNLSAQTNGQSWSNGHFGVSDGTNCFIGNNTLVNFDTTPRGIGISCGNGWVITNNVHYGIATPVSVGSVPLNGLDTNRFHCDYNVYYNSSGNGANGSFFVDGFRSTSFSGWKSFYGAGALDSHSTTNMPALNSSYAPTAVDTVAKGQGVSMATFFAIDKNGATRTVPWSIGAFVAAGSGGSSLPAVTLSGRVVVNGRTVLQ